MAITTENRSLDRIVIRDLLVRGIVGINAKERRDRQDILINVTMWADTRPAAASDDIADAVNYRTIAKRILALAEQSNFRLVERFAEEIAAVCLEEPRVKGVRVTVEKPGALRFARSVSVTIERGQFGG